MQDLLNHPAIQAAVIPFIISVITAAVFAKIRPDMSALALLVGFMTTCLLITDLSLQPITSTKKLILLTIFSALLGMVLQFRPLKKIPLLILITIGSLIACSWLLWPVLSRKEPFDAMVLLLPLSLYSLVVIALTTYSTSVTKRTTDVRLIAIVFALVTSVSCLIGASALYGQMAAALAASSTGLLLLGWLFAGKKFGFSLPESRQADELFVILLFLPVSFIAIAASVYAKLPWYVLPCIACIPAVLLLNIKDSYLYWQRLLIRTGLATLPGGLALYLTWEAAGPVPF